MEPSVGSILVIFVGAPLALAAVVTLLVLLLTSRARSSTPSATSEQRAVATDVTESSGSAEDSGPGSGPVP